MPTPSDATYGPDFQASDALVDGTIACRGAADPRRPPTATVGMGLAGSWAAGAVLVDEDEPARFDQVTTARVRHTFTGGRPVYLSDHLDGWRWQPYAVDGADVESGASAAPAPDA